MGDALPVDDATAQWMLVVGGGVTLVACLVAYVYLGACLTVLARKTGTPHGWLAWFPPLNVFLMQQIGRCSVFWALLAFVPLLQVIAFVVIWAAIAQARGKSAWAGVLLLVPVIGFFVPAWLASGPALGAGPGGVPGGVNTVNVTVPQRACTKCGAPASSADTFCGSCGQPLPAGPPVAAPATVVAVTQTAPAAPVVRSGGGGGGCAIAAMILVMGMAAMCCLPCCGLGGFLFLAPVLDENLSRQPPALPERIAGTRREFPLDTAPVQPFEPAAVASRTLPDPAAAAAGTAPATTASIPAEMLPPGVDPTLLPELASAMTTATYRESPESPPIYITVLDGARDPNAGGRITQAVSSTVSGGIETGQQITSPNGATYVGTRIASSTEIVYVLTNPQTSSVVILYTPGAWQVEAAVDRLAQNVGNGQGLDDPAYVDYVCVLPAYEPPGLELLAVQTITGAELRAGNRQLIAEAEAEGAGDMAGWLSQAEGFLPEMVTLAQYADGNQREWGVMALDFGSTRKAWWLWLVLSWTMGSAEGASSVPVYGGDGLVFTDPGGGGQALLLFQKGPYLIGVMGPAEESPHGLVTLAEQLQP